MQEEFIQTIKSINDKEMKELVQLFIQRVGKNFLTRDENRLDHFGSFFVPVHVPSQSIFLVHHKKAGSWIPPGGHVDKNESPLITVIREFFEELHFKINKNMVELFYLSITNIDRTRFVKYGCKIHFDLWYKVPLARKINFKFDKNEFFDARWFSYKKALSLIRKPSFRQAIKKTYETI